jgi:hypothetical protein
MLRLSHSTHLSANNALQLFVLLSDMPVYCLLPAPLQAVSRVWRYGQTRPCYIYHLLYGGTFETRVFERVLVKEELFERVSRFGRRGWTVLLRLGVCVGTQGKSKCVFWRRAACCMLVSCSRLRPTHGAAAAGAACHPWRPPFCEGLSQAHLHLLSLNVCPHRWLSARARRPSCVARTLTCTALRRSGPCPLVPLALRCRRCLQQPGLAVQRTRRC